MGTRDDEGFDPRRLPKSPDGVRHAWFVIEDTWRTTFERAGRLPERVLHDHVDGEWSFIETQRHLIFVIDAWIRRTVLGELAPYHHLGLPPDHRIGVPEPGVDVIPWGIDVFAEASFDEVLDVRRGRMRCVREVVDGLAVGDLTRMCKHNPAAGFPPSTVVPIGFCLDLVIGEELAHHAFATRDLAVLEGHEGVVAEELGEPGPV